MWNTLEHVAESNLLDTKQFVEFANAHAEEFDVLDGSVNTWHSNSLIKAYTASITSEEWERQRTLAIERLKRIMSGVE
jgi:hypothetical protein